eukprot:4854091-Prymnesium_polylepis.1
MLTPDQLWLRLLAVVNKVSQIIPGTLHDGFSLIDTARAAHLAHKLAKAFMLAGSKRAAHSMICGCHALATASCPMNRIEPVSCE